MEGLKAWWRSMRPTQRKRFILVMMIPLLGLSFTGYQLIRTIFTEQTAKAYDVTPSAAVAPRTEGTLFSVEFTTRPLVTDDIFFGLHDQLDKDLVWIAKLDQDEADKRGGQVSDTISNIRSLLGSGTVSADPESVVSNVRKTGARSGEVGVSIVYQVRGQNFPVQYSLVYEITASKTVAAGAYPTYAFELEELDSDVANASSGEQPGFESGQELID